MIDSNKKECPFCGEIIWADDTYCKHCSEKLDVKCPNCGEVVSAQARICPKCSAGLTPQEIEVKTPWATTTMVFSIFFSMICFAIMVDSSNPYNYEPPLNTMEGKIDCIKTLIFCFLFPLVSAIIALNGKKEGFTKVVIFLVLAGIFGFLALVTIAGV